MFDMGDDDASFFDARRERTVVLGHDVWIGHGAAVMPGVEIGTGAAVGSNAVVTRDVAPFTVVAGSPARPIRQRFPDEVAQGLLELAWWDWPHERIRAALPDFRMLDAAAFVARYRD
jgi:acetyltransferase-like isoleucine patch superfamily enzyme